MQELVLRADTRARTHVDQWIHRPLNQISTTKQFGEMTQMDERQ